jgi:gamma-glutamyltranspeptidase/glutathione hydrolase
MRFSPQYERLPVYGTEHAIATSHPTASAVGHAVLQAGGNAVDAALAAHAVLCVCEPGMTGVGGDCFVLYFDAARRQVIALNGSGYAPIGQGSGVPASELQPESGIAVTIPGAVDAWCRLAHDYGSRPLEELFAPAIRLAREGAPVHARVAWDWANEAERLARDPVARRVFLKDGEAPRAGALHAQPLLAETLEAIAARGRAAFYEGGIAEDIVATLRSRGGAHSMDDMADYASFYTTPIETTFAGHRIVECPPNGQGVIALLLLDILGEAAKVLPPRSEADWIHLLAEATKLAYGVRDELLADERHLGETVASLLRPERSRQLARRIGARASPLVEVAPPQGGNTTYLCAVDRNGNCISFINSLYDAFGSCIVTPRFGVLLNNRGMCFSTVRGHPNEIGPGKRPLQTIIPGMILDSDDSPVGSFGVMGGHYQAAGHADFVRRLLIEGLDPQQAINAPRTFATEGVLRVEPILPEALRLDLTRRGHRLPQWTRPIGGAQAIIRDASGTLIAASDPRKDGCAIAI